MNYRLATLLAATTVAADGTTTVDIDVVDPITAIIVEHTVINGAQNGSDGHPVRCVTKIELIDGSDVLFSLSGAEAQALAYYQTKVAPRQFIYYTNGSASWTIIPMLFGRHLYDSELALDPTRFKNLKLRVTIDVDAGGINSSTGELAIFAHLFDQKVISPIGFLMSKEIKSYTLVNDSHEYTDLPLDHPYRKLLIRAQYYTKGPNEEIANIKLTEDVDKKVPFNQSLDEILMTIQSFTPPFTEGIIGAGRTTADTFHCTPTYDPFFAVAGWRATAGGGERNIYQGDGGRFQYIQEDTGPNWQCLVHGWAPHGVIELPFGLQDDIADWYDPTGLGNLKLDLTGGGAVGTTPTCEIFLQQLRRY